MATLNLSAVHVEAIGEDETLFNCVENDKLSQFMIEFYKRNIFNKFNNKTTLYFVVEKKIIFYSISYLQFKKYSLSFTSLHFYRKGDLKLTSVKEMIALTFKEITLKSIKFLKRNLHEKKIKEKKWPDKKV